MSMTHHGMSGHPSDEYYGCKLCTEPKIKTLESRNKELEGQLAKLLVRFEERTALIPDLEAEVHDLREALKQIVKCNVHVDLKCGRCNEEAKAALEGGK